ncbi:MAG TPA: hypothetical protein VHB45_16185 [Alloacidobacterium sp.]|nr:hypothetical protein [Alloacidobacterium sp.]
MPNSELVDERVTEEQHTGPVDLLIGIAGAVRAEELQAHVSKLQGLAQAHIAVAYPGSGKPESVPAADAGFRLVPYSVAAADPASLPWVVSAAAQRAICTLAAELDAKACVVVHGDLIAFDTAHIQSLSHAVAEKGCDLILPVYPSRKYEALLNHGILAPLTRALYGQRVRYPLPPDFGCSPQMFRKLSTARDLGDGGLLWPSVQAAASNYQVCQVNLDVHHATQTEGLELSAVLASLAGSAFAEMDAMAAYWQRVRSSHATATFGSTAAQVGDGEPADTKPLIDSFLLGSRNLQEIWGLVLPPVTLLELKRLTRVSPEAFRMPDSLWVRIIYDFALAYRLRKMNRGHLMGALTPLYLGWVASYMQEVAALSPIAAEQRFEQLARAYEEEKPYLVSRWRWPDRFNP